MLLGVLTHVKCIVLFAFRFSPTYTGNMQKQSQVTDKLPKNRLKFTMKVLWLALNLQSNAIVYFPLDLHFWKLNTQNYSSETIKSLDFKGLVYILFSLRPI